MTSCPVPRELNWSMTLPLKNSLKGNKKLFYRIGEASRITGEKPHVLRYWETEFEELSPRKGPGGIRLYRNSDLEMVFSIKKLLHEQRYSIEGARKALRQQKKIKKNNASQLQMDFTSDKRKHIRNAIRQIRHEIEDLVRILDGK